MEKFEEGTLKSADLKPTMWRRYVDDTFVLWTHGTDQLQQFHRHLNEQHPKIQFTREEEKQQSNKFSWTS